VPFSYLLKKHYEDETCQYMAATQILSYINGRIGVQTNQGNVIALSKALNKAGFTRTKKGSRYVWRVIQIDDGEVLSDKYQEPQNDEVEEDSFSEDAGLPF